MHRNGIGRGCRSPCDVLQQGLRTIILKDYRGRSNCRVVLSIKIAVTVVGITRYKVMFIFLII